MACKGCSKKKKERREQIHANKDSTHSIGPCKGDIWNIERHIGSAIQQMYETRCGYNHEVLAVGNLIRAMELASKYATLRSEIKNTILAIKNGTNPNFNNCINRLAEASLIASDKDEDDNSESKTPKNISIITRSSCLECVVKHLSSAMVIFDEDPIGHYNYMLAVGHLAEAEQESQEYPKIEDSIYTLRMLLQSNYQSNLVIIDPAIKETAGEIVKIIFYTIESE